ncbi:MAG: hypothetical protein Q9165_001303 [Trypethelium subeluteriae]
MWIDGIEVKDIRLISIVFACVCTVIYLIDHCLYLRYGQDDVSEIDHVRDLEGLMTETLHHRQLEILCRYGDYLAERLGTLRQHISEHNLETVHKLSEHWTKTSATLKAEEGHDDAPCHDLVRAAAQGLQWRQDTTNFIIHEYAKRNNLMHAELFDLVERRDWPAIGRRSRRDVETLRELFVNSDASAQAAIESWEQIILDFRDRWVRRSEDGTTWEARSIIAEALADGVDDRASLTKLAKSPRDVTPAERNTTIANLKKENALKVPQRNKAQQRADAALQEDNRRLQAEVECLQRLLEPRGASEDFSTKLQDEVRRNDKLERENQRCQNRIKQLMKMNGTGVALERERKRNASSRAKLLKRLSL